MEATTPLSDGAPRPASEIASQNRRAETVLYVVLTVIALAVTPLLGLFGGSVAMAIIAVPIGFALATIVMLRPVAGLYAVLACAVVVEQLPLANSNLTDHLYVFYWPPSLAGMPERPIGFFLLFVFCILVFQHFTGRRKLLAGGPLIVAFALFLLCVLIGVLHGLQSGGDFKTIVLELRSLWYLFLTYVLAYNIIEDKRHVRAFFWIVVAGAGIKGLQGTYVAVIKLHLHLSNVNEIMAHEDSIFFAALLLLIVLFLLLHRDRGQLRLALAIAPFALVALVANNRRTSYVALLLGIAVAWALVMVVKPAMRRRMGIAGVVILLLCVGYVVALGHSTSTLAAPARSIMSTIHPDPSDVRNTDSNLYRTFENYDLKYTAMQSPIIGYGFGKPFLQPMLLPDIGAADPVYLFIPHNTVYWIWMRLGLLGFSAFWYLIGSIIIRGCHILKSLRDPYLQLVAIFAICVTLMEVLAAYADYQLYFFRNVFYLGLLLGVLMRLPAVEARERADAGAGPAKARVRSDDRPRLPSVPVERGARTLAGFAR